PGATAVSTSGYAGAAIEPGGTVWDWGVPGLGNGRGDGSSTPVQVRGLTKITAVSVGIDKLALRSDGTVWEWGFADMWGLGPVKVSGLSDVVAIAAGQNAVAFNLALKEDGTVWSWGQNPDGELGNGTTTDSWTPVQVSGLTDVVAIAAG